MIQINFTPLGFDGQSQENEKNKLCYYDSAHAYFVRIRQLICESAQNLAQKYLHNLYSVLKYF